MTYRCFTCDILLDKPPAYGLILQRPDGELLDQYYCSSTCAIIDLFYFNHVLLGLDCEASRFAIKAQFNFTDEQIDKAFNSPQGAELIPLIKTMPGGVL